VLFVLGWTLAIFILFSLFGCSGRESNDLGERINPLCTVLYLLINQGKPANLVLPYTRSLSGSWR
jgi:hypothetical protein